MKQFDAFLSVDYIYKQFLILLQLMETSSLQFPTIR